MALENLNYSQSPLSDCLKKKRSKRRRHDYEQSEDLNYIARCLIQLARGGGTTIPAQPNKKIHHHGEQISYPCTVCDRIFSSYQALGGHTACHRPKRNSPTDEVFAGMNPNSHTCGKSFNTGQALGGHMRRHFKEEGNRAVDVQSSPETIVKPARSFDLNFPPPSESEGGVVESAFIDLGS